MRQIRPANFCRSWLFLEGVNAAVLGSAPSSGADVLIQELEDFTPPSLRPAARALAADLYAAWRQVGAVPRFERDYGIPAGSTALLPKIEFARGLVQLQAIAKASPRVAACLLAAEDLAADLPRRAPWFAGRAADLH